MNQNICSRCHTPNSPDKAFCTNCGQSMAVNQPVNSSDLPPTVFAGSANAPGFSPNQPNFSSQGSNQFPPPPPPPSSQPAPKKSRMGLWLGILGGVGLLIILVGGIGLVGLYYFLRSGKPDINYNYNSTPSNSSHGNTLPKNNSNLSNNSPADSAAMTEDEKYRLFYAASKADDKSMVMKVSRKIGIIDESGKPTAYYKTFTGGIVSWAMRDTEFVRKVDTKEKARDYINSQMSGGSTSSTQELNPTSRDVSLGVVNGKATNLVQPPYPPAAKAVKASGPVNVQVTINEEGSVISASATSGHPLLRASAEQAARSSKFSPTLLSGQPVKANGIVVYNFVAE